MKKQFLILATGGLLIASACDSLNQENTLPDAELVSNLNESDLDGANLRAFPKVSHDLVNKASKNYNLMENAYFQLMSEISPEEATRTLEDSRTKGLFVQEMMRKSTRVFDQNIFRNSRFLSFYAKSKHQAMAAEHEEEIDIHDIQFFLDDEEAALGAFVKIPDLPGESEGNRSFPFFKIAGKTSTATIGGCAGGGTWCDSIPPIKQPQLEETYEFLIKLERFNGEPSQTVAGLEELEISAGINPVALGLLLPAVQPARDAVRKKEENARGKADILYESLPPHYGIPESNFKGKFLKYGGVGSIGALISEAYQADGDMDWASIQLNRSKFELEMLFLWSRFWDEKTSTDPTTGR